MTTPTTNPIGEEDNLRANTYSLLAALFAAPPQADLIDRLLQAGSLPSSTNKVNSPLPASETTENSLAHAWQILREAAQTADIDAIDSEYHTLFIGVGRGELIPYGSWYQTGFMMDRPLAALRTELDALGFERIDGVKEPEDHVAALLETMALIITTDEFTFETQQRFFTRHIDPWMHSFFKDLTKANNADFYSKVGRFATTFLTFESRYLSSTIVPSTSTSTT
ncbi:TorD/DmsD family molecular chaperone [Thioalkalivibrio sp. HK1]|uniref:TorD/DmsD family molecular chaperone n=1 Tax=Thioalkalivibrio sp. HK1 TaxID=1469245 RepID=UPI000472C103|nr:molecular chaperone TorD family protein [Thioalkalivibrio sp. HK1]